MATAGAKNLSQDSSRFCHVVWILLFFSLRMVSVVRERRGGHKAVSAVVNVVRPPGPVGMVISIVA